MSGLPWRTGPTLTEKPKLSEFFRQFERTAYSCFRTQALIHLQPAITLTQTLSSKPVLLPDGRIEHRAFHGSFQ